MNARPLHVAIAILTVLVILSPSLEAEEEKYSGAAELITCRFDEEWDKNHDLWPDGWQRRVDESYPAYVRIKIDGGIDGGQASDTGRRFVVTLDGGSAYFQSPSVPVS